MKNRTLRASFVIASYKHFGLVEKCIASIRTQEPNNGEYEIIVVDDCSGQDVKDKLEVLCKKEQVTLLHNEKNSGYIATANKGILASIGKLIIMTNSDVEYLTPCIDQFEADLKQDPRIAIIGCKLVYPNMKVQHAGVALTPGTLNFHHVYSSSDRHHPLVCKPRYCISVTGAVYAIDASKISRLGLFNDDYFISFDDSEYSVNCWSRGYKVFYDPRVEAIHLEGYTRGATPKDKETKGTWDKEAASSIFWTRNMRSYNLSEIQNLVDEANAKATILTQTTQPVKRVRTEPPNKTILVKRRGALGDVLLTTPIVRHLRGMNPQAQIIVATDSKDVFKNNPHVDKVVDHGDLAHATIPADHVVDLNMVYECSPKEHIIDAYSNFTFGHKQIEKRIELFYNETDATRVDAFLATRHINLARLVMVHMGMTWMNRTWPHMNWMRVVRTLSDAGWHVVVVGSGDDFRTNDQIPRVHDAHNVFSIQEIAYLSARSKAFIGIDSGIFHIAGTTKVPIVGIFTSVNPDYRMAFRPGQKDHGLVPVTPAINCKGCLHEEKPPVTYCGCKRNDFACLQEVTVEMVLDGFRKAVQLF